MQRTMLKSKIHRVIITGSDPAHVGPITAHPTPFDVAGTFTHEQVHADPTSAIFRVGGAVDVPLTEVAP